MKAEVGDDGDNMNKNTRNEHALDGSCKQKKKIEFLGEV
jgi:hypothetical protein